MTNHLIRKACASVAAIGLVAGGATAAPTGIADAAAQPSPLVLEAASKSVTLESFEGTVFLDLGVFAVAGDRPFEVRAYRSSYSQPITALHSLPGPDVVLPARLVKDFSGLSNFFSVSIKDRKGKSVLKTSAPFCPNGDDTVRRWPEAPATSPYPEDCAANPYSTGAVWGLQRGYASPALQFTEASLKAGRYTATVAITPAYRTALHIRAADARARVAVKVVKSHDEDSLSARQWAASRRQTLATAPTMPKGKATKPQGPLPDLRSLPAWGIAVEKGRYLNFSATVWNAGASPLVVDGFRKPKNEKVMDAYQYFFDSAGRQTGYAPAGTMKWDAREGHTHWHFTDFATYRLLDKHKKLVLRSQKEAFCLANTDAVDYTVPHANWRPENTDLESSCGEQSSIGVREVLDTGSGDTYEQDLPGQSFDLRGLKNGTYYIQIKANPDQRLHETTRDNNTSYRKVTISGLRSHRKVAAQKVGLIVEPPAELEEPKLPRPR
jgi:hypothetical protein